MLELGRRVLLFQIEAPGKGRDRDASTEPKELNAVDLGRLAVEHARAGPVGTRPPKRRVGFVVARDQHGWDVEADERLQRSLKPQPDRGEIARADQYIRAACQLGKPLRLST